MLMQTMAKEMEISPSYLSMLVHGKREWSPALYTAYQNISRRENLAQKPHQLVKNLPTSQAKLHNISYDELLRQQGNSQPRRGGGV